MSHNIGCTGDIIILYCLKDDHHYKISIFLLRAKRFKGIYGYTGVITHVMTQGKLQIPLFHVYNWFMDVPGYYDLS